MSLAVKMERSETAITEHAMTQAGEIAERTGRDRSLDEGDELDWPVRTLTGGKHGCQLLGGAAGGSEARCRSEWRYDGKRGTNRRPEREWWLRRLVRMRAELASAELLAHRGHLVTAITAESTNLDGLNIVVQVLSARSGDRQRLLTVCVVNRQVQARVWPMSIACSRHSSKRIDTEGGAGKCLPYPGPAIEAMDEEGASMELVYRNQRTLAVGHGCAANWGIGEGPKRAWRSGVCACYGPGGLGRLAHADWVSAECLPAVEIPNMTPEITGELERAGCCVDAGAGGVSAGAGWHV